MEPLYKLAASVIAARKGEHDIAIGNVVGSNMFNLLAVIGIAVVIAPMNNIPLEVLQIDWIIMLSFNNCTLYYRLMALKEEMEE